MRFIANDIDDQVHRLGIDAQRTRDRVEARLQFREQANEFIWLKFGRRMLQEEIDHLHPPKVNLEIVLVIGLKQFFQQRSGRGALDDCF